MAPLRLGVLISGRGSNLAALIEACAEPDFPARIACVISNNPSAAGLQRARAAGLPAHVVDQRRCKDRAAFEAGLDGVLEAAAVELVCLAGFMRLLSADFVERRRDRIINIHPSLLPAFPGLHVHRRVLEAGVRITGCTVHVVRAEVDSGPIVAQAAVPVAPGDDERDLEARVLRAEHRLYPLAVRLIAEGRVRVDRERAVVDAGTADAALFSPSVD